MIRKEIPSTAAADGSGGVWERSDGRQKRSNARATDANLPTFEGALERRPMTTEMRTGLINGCNAVKGERPFSCPSRVADWAHFLGLAATPTTHVSPLPPSIFC